MKNVVPSLLKRARDGLLSCLLVALVATSCDYLNDDMTTSGRAGQVTGPPGGFLQVQAGSCTFRRVAIQRFGSQTLGILKVEDPVGHGWSCGVSASIA